MPDVTRGIRPYAPCQLAGVITLNSTWASVITLDSTSVITLALVILTRLAISQRQAMLRVMRTCFPNTAAVKARRREGTFRREGMTP